MMEEKTVDIMVKKIEAGLITGIDKKTGRVITIKFDSKTVFKEKKIRIGDEKKVVSEKEINYKELNPDDDLTIFYIPKRNDDTCKKIVKMVGDFSNNKKIRKVTE